jgi:hypothetical protein
VSGVEYPPGVTVIEPRRERYHGCELCMGQISLICRYVVASTHIGSPGQARVVEFHETCWESARPTVVDGLVTAWRCHCCTCGPDGPEGHSMTCRTVAPHAQDGCEHHGQPAERCDCGCES